MDILHNTENLLGSIPSFFTSAHSAQGTPPPAAAPQTYNVRGVQMTPQDLQTLRNVLFAEISNRGSDKQQLEARTIANTALNRIPQYGAQGKNMSLHDVLTAPNQYQGYNSPQYQRIASNATTTADAQKLGAIDSVIGEMKTGKFPDTTGGRVYYHHDPQGQIWLRDGSLYKQPATRTVADLGQ